MDPSVTSENTAERRFFFLPTFVARILAESNLERYPCLMSVLVASILACNAGKTPAGGTVWPRTPHSSSTAPVIAEPASTFSLAISQSERLAHRKHTGMFNRCAGGGSRAFSVAPFHQLNGVFAIAFTLIYMAHIPPLMYG